MHGILDTSMGWVANGTGSHAFAAYDQGMDVWLGSSRANPPREHTGRVYVQCKMRAPDLPSMIQEVVRASGKRNLYHPFLVLMQVG